MLFRTLPIDPFACSHHRAADYFTESIRSDLGFWGWPCNSYISYMLGLCPRTNELHLAGEDTRETSKGKNNKLLFTLIALFLLWFLHCFFF